MSSSAAETASESAASDCGNYAGVSLHARPWFRGMLAGVLTLLFSVGVACGYLTWGNLGFEREMLGDGFSAEDVQGMRPGYGDIPAFVIWSSGLVMMIFLYVAFAANRAAAGSVFRKLAYILCVPFLAVIWTIGVSIMLGPWFGAFSFPVLPCWVIGATCAAVLSLLVWPAGRNPPTPPATERSDAADSR
jgi:hypothetical protein